MRSLVVLLLLVVCLDYWWFGLYCWFVVVGRWGLGLCYCVIRLNIWIVIVWCGCGYGGRFGLGWRDRVSLGFLVVGWVRDWCVSVVDNWWNWLVKRIWYVVFGVCWLCWLVCGNWMWSSDSWWWRIVCWWYWRFVNKICLLFSYYVYCYLCWYVNSLVISLVNWLVWLGWCLVLLIGMLVLGVVWGCWLCCCLVCVGKVYLWMVSCCWYCGFVLVWCCNVYC